MVDLYNTGFEKSILATLIYETLEDTRSKEINVLTYLNRTDFYLPAYADIYGIMQKLASNNIEIDENMLQVELEKIGKFNNYADVLIDILTANPVSNIAVYANEIKKRKSLRDVLKLIPSIQSDVNEYKEPGEILTNIAISIEDLQKNENSRNTIFDGEELLLEYQEHGLSENISLNFPPFLEVLPDGIEKGTMVLVVGEPETGKTHISFSIAEHASLTNKTGIVSLEFGKEDYQRRLVQMVKNGIIKKPQNILTNFDAFSMQSLIVTLYRFAASGVKLVVIETLHLIENDRFREKTDAIEDVAIQIDRVMKKTGMVCFLIAFGSKNDYEKGGLGVKNSSIVPHLSKIFLRVLNGDKEREAKVQWLKNKQTKKKPIQNLVFCEDGKIVLKNSIINNKKVISLATT
jgi:hypothetical protein